MAMAPLYQPTPIATQPKNEGRKGFSSIYGKISLLCGFQAQMDCTAICLLLGESSLRIHLCLAAQMSTWSKIRTNITLLVHRGFNQIMTK
jgi:hypothetical protein